MGRTVRAGEETHKGCTRCKNELPFSEFTNHKNGRYGLDSQCRSCRKKIKAKWYSDNAETRRKVHRDWRAKNKEHISKYNKEYSKENKEKIRAKQADWRSENKDYFVEWTKANRAAAREKILRRRAAKNKAFPAWANRERIIEIYRLAVEKTKLTGIKHEVDHIVPLQGRIVCGLHVEHNLRVVTMDENRSKFNSYWPQMP